MIGTIINDKFEIKQTLAESHMYDVYQAVERETGMPVAVKLLHAEMAESQERVKAFSEEVRMIAGLNHPSLAQVLDFDVHDGRPYCVTEFIEGKDLRDGIRGDRPISFFDACRAIQQLAVLLQHACDQKLAVRTIKLSNILRTNTGLVKVLSFSLPRLRLVGGAGDETGGIQSDLFFLGTTLFELLAGESPMRKRGGINEIWDDKLRQALRIRHSQLTPEQIDMVVAFVERTLTREVKNRFSDHAAFLIGLSDLMHVSGDAERNERDLKRRRLSNASDVVDAFNGRMAQTTAAAVGAVPAPALQAANEGGSMAAAARRTGGAKVVPLTRSATATASTAGTGVGFVGSAALAVAAETEPSPASTLCPAEEMQLRGDREGAAKPVLRLLNSAKDRAEAASPTGKIWQNIEEQPWVRHPYATIGIGGFLLVVFVLLLIFW
ncbi:MAG TPA: protein kinase [Candidatus Ozemobacteraceae bacterium]|nr:protein kinase [Candidatus Ozemobacteraceae bacterium]